MEMFESIKNLFRKYLLKNESFSKTILACLSGAQVGSIHEEKKCNKKSRDTATLNASWGQWIRTMADSKIRAQ